LVIAPTTRRPGQAHGKEPQVREYDLCLILKPDLGEDGINSASERVGGWISSSGGEVVNVTNAGRKRLAYPIKHSRDGAYVVLNFRGRPEGLGEVERNLKLSDDVLRHFVIRR
jgi:small subunit ribosomal protein S6